MITTDLMDKYEAATKGNAPEIIEVMRRVERGFEKCWQAVDADPAFKAELGDVSTQELLAEIITFGRLTNVELLKIDDDDVEHAYVAWLAFENAAAKIEQSRRKA